MHAQKNPYKPCEAYVPCYQIVRMGEKGWCILGQAFTLINENGWYFFTNQRLPTPPRPNN